MLAQEQGITPRALITTITDTYDRVSMHGVRRSLLVAQAQATGIPLVEIEIPANCSNEVYEQRTGAAMSSEPLRDLDVFAFGDLFLADIRAYRETALALIGKRAIFPLWHRDTAALARTFIDAGFQAILACVDPSQLDPSFAGRAFDERLLDGASGHASIRVARTASSTPSSMRAPSCGSRCRS